MSMAISTLLTLCSKHRGAAIKLEEESSIKREDKVVADFREALLSGNLDQALLQLEPILSDKSFKQVALFHKFTKIGS